MESYLQGKKKAASGGMRRRAWKKVPPESHSGEISAILESQLLLGGRSVSYQLKKEVDTRTRENGRLFITKRTRIRLL